MNTRPLTPALIALLSAVGTGLSFPAVAQTPAIDSRTSACVRVERATPSENMLEGLMYEACLQRAKTDPCDLITDKKESYLCHYPQRPSGPTIIRKDNITVIETHGYDLSLENNLREGRVSIVEMGYYWCSPCAAWKHQVGRKADSFPGIDFVIVGLSYPGDGKKESDVNSPAVRYISEHQGTGVPFFLVYEGKRLLHTREGIDVLSGRFEDKVKKIVDKE